ncbi:kinesin-like protein KIF26A [Pimephales promelas]|nr:kinesin-like protein KIF26A [Pimephales promelas]
MAPGRSPQTLELLDSSNIIPNDWALTCAWQIRDLLRNGSTVYATDLHFSMAFTSGTQMSRSDLKSRHSSLNEKPCVEGCSSGESSLSLELSPRRRRLSAEEEMCAGRPAPEGAGAVSVSESDRDETRPDLCKQCQMTVAELRRQALALSDPASLKDINYFLTPLPEKSSRFSREARLVEVELKVYWKSWFDLLVPFFTLNPAGEAANSQRKLLNVAGFLPAIKVIVRAIADMAYRAGAGSEY